MNGKIQLYSYNFRPKDFEFHVGLSTVTVAGPSSNVILMLQWYANSSGFKCYTRFHIFRNFYSFQYDLTIDYLCIGGGGGGGHGGGGGGAGGYRNSCPGELTGGGGSMKLP